VTLLALSTRRVTDAELVDAARRGDASAFDELVERHRSAVYRTALAACGSRPDAEETAQDAFVAAWMALNAFRGDAQFKTWILAIVWRRALSRRRSIWQRLRRFSSSESEPYDAASTARNSEQRLLDRQLADDMARVVRSLPSKLRDPLLLATTGDCTFAEMSTVLRVPEGTLKWRVREARRRVRQKLTALGYQFQ
jgi:RNA polymerase sigma-70 factor (ECF subfamily)